MADKKHWNIKPINNTGATYRVVYGQRGPGKTFGVLHYALERWMKDRTKLAIIRRMDEDFTGANSARSNYDMLITDANGDNNIDIADSVLIMQSLANPSKYGVSGTDDRHITEEGKARADVDGEGVTNRDALTIQKYLLGFFKVN